VAQNKTRRFPLVLSMIGTAAAVSAALYYRQQLDEYHPNRIVLDLNSDDILRLSTGGSQLTYWNDEHGSHYTVTDRKTEK
jgi:hypothetical protein